MAVIDRERWRTLEPLLDQALELEPDERARWFDELRDSSPDIIADLTALLARDETAERSHFLERPANVSLAGLELDGWTLERPLGYGGMGSVWLARRSDGRFEGKAAVKLLSLALVDAMGVSRFRREGSVLARLTHPAIARLLDAGVTPGGQPFLVIEYVEGTRIDIWADERRLSDKDRVRLFVDVLDAVVHAHASLVVHRDLKPSNILVTPTGDVKLLDFGIAKLLDDDVANPATESSASSMMTTTEGWRALTPEYAAPEQVTGMGPDPTGHPGVITTATDIYAAGVLLYVLLSGKHPTAEGCRTPAEVLAALVERQAAPLGLGDLDTVVAKALRKEPSERYVTAAALADDLTRWLHHKPVLARPQSWTYRARKFVRRHRIPLALGAASLMLAVAYVATALNDRAHLQRALGEATTNAQRAEHVTDFAVGLFEATGGARGGPAYADSLSARDLLNRATHRAKELEAQPVVRAQMLGVIGRIRSHLGDYDGARTALDEALAIRVRVLGENHPDVATTAIMIADAVEHGDRSDSTVTPLLRHAVAIRRSLYGNNDTRTADALYALAKEMHTEGQYKAAKPVLDEWMTLMQRLPMRYTPEMSGQLHNMAQVLTYSRRRAEAEQLLRRATSIDSAWYGPENYRVAIDLSLLGAVIGDQGRPNEAEPIELRGIALLRRAYPNGNIEVAHALRSLALMYNDLYRFEEAAALLRETMPMYLAAGGPQSMSYVTVMSALGKSLVGMRRYAEAETLLRRVLTLDHAKRPSPNFIRDRTQLWLALALAGQGKYSEAEPVLRQNFSVTRRMGFVLSDLQMTSEALMKIYESQGRPAEAARYRLPDSLQASTLLAKYRAMQ
jgi:eukaryotic-like serine/threonine-protein kinase